MSSRRAPSCCLLALLVVGAILVGPSGCAQVGPATDKKDASAPPDANDAGPPGGRDAAPPIVDAGFKREAAGEVKEDPNLIDCPNLAQYILILDFRSGWWGGAGGGGDSIAAGAPSGARGDGFVGTILPLIADPCPNTRLEYHHILKDGEQACGYPPRAGGEMCVYSAHTNVVFRESDWNNYTQIWILSGSEKDASDLEAASALFKKIAEASRATCLPFFFGLGSGFIDHANRAAEAVGVGTIAATNLAMPNFWIYDPRSTATSTMTGAQLRTHVLFTGVTSLADAVDGFAGNTSVAGDRLVDNALVEVIARDNTGAASIGVGRVTPTKELVKGRPFVIDAGAQRFYLVDKTIHSGTLTYLRNLTNYLGSVGCKSDEDPIIVE